MKANIKSLWLLFFLVPFTASAQNLEAEKVNVTFKDGVSFKHENDFLVRARFRIQNRLTLESKKASGSDLDSADFAVRRARLRFDGHAYDPKFLYRLQLSFTRQDQDWDNTGVPNVLRDAVFGWRWNPNHTLWIGVSKLPGNRQRVMSSGSLQLVDRSIMNATFNIDRDTGVQHYSVFGEEQPLWLKFALTNGEGRGQTNPNASIARTARVEWYPLGKFNQDGDYFEADLFREPKPKLVLGFTHSANQLSARTGGQTGRLLPDGNYRSMETHFADALFKYRGFSFLGEWARRTAPSPIVTGSRYIYSGEGFNLQGGYVLESNWEPSARFSMITPESEIKSVAQEQRNYTVGLSKYINNNVFKVQSDLTYQEFASNDSTAYSSNWVMRLQLEFGI